MALTVVVVNDSAEVVGGAAAVAIASAAGLARRGHRVLFFAASPGCDPSLHNQDNLTVLSTAQYDILSDPNRLRAASQGLYNRRAVRGLAATLATLDPARTVVHLHTWVKALSPFVARVALARRFATVCTLHDYFTACPTGSFYLHHRQSLCPHRPLSPGCFAEACDARHYSHKLWRSLRLVLQRQLCTGQLRHFISVSEMTGQLLRPYLPRQAEITVIPNPVEVPHGPPVAVANNRSFVAVGRLAPEKGLDLFAVAAGRLGIPATLLGDGESRERLLALNPALSVSGWLAKDRLLARLREARALVFPSLWYETFGLVVAEAAALGIPAIVPDASAARELVEDGSTGLLFRRGDGADLEAKLALLQRDPALAARLGETAYARYWQQPLSLARHLDSLEKLYARMLA